MAPVGPALLVHDAVLLLLEIMVMKTNVRFSFFKVLGDLGGVWVRDGFWDIKSRKYYN